MTLTLESEHMTLRGTLPAIAILALTGCGVRMTTTHIARPYAPLPPETPIQVSSVGLPSCPFEELALVTIRESLDVRNDGMLRALEDEARMLGGHALVGLRQVWFDEDDDDPGLTATVVRYLEDDCRY